MRMLHTLIDRRRACIAAVLASVLAAAAFADDEVVVDPPDRVARVSFVAGAVSLLAAGADEWVDATLNRPLTNGDKLWVDRDARAELQIGPATIHLDENSGFSFVALDDDVLQANLSDGAMAIEVRSIEPHERIEVDTPNAAVVLPQAGDYTISTEASGDRTIVKSHAGEAVVSGADQHEFIVAATQQGVFTGNQELTAEMMEIGGRGPFETWAYQRNHAETGSVAARYVAPGVVGYQDLDANGSWAYEPEYGQVWQPTTLIYTDWAPYRYGRWAWIQPWGWTWIDDAPWGFAPFHYGRWLHLRQRWCWLPGPIHARPIYAPALVAWSGNPRGAYGPYMGFADNVAWFPLGPREVFVPAYRSSWAHFREVNASNAAFVDNAYLSNAYYTRNVHVDYRNRNAITAVDRDAFALSQRTAAHRVQVDADDVAKWQPQAAAPAIVPTRDARLGARPVGHDPAPRLDRQITIIHPETPPSNPAAWGGDRPHSADRPHTTERAPFHYNGAFQNNGAFQRPNGTTQSHEAPPPQPPHAQPRPMPGAPPHHRDIEMRQTEGRQPETRPAHQNATPTAGAQPTRPANGAPNSRTGGQAYGSTLNGGDRHGHLGNAQRAH